MNPLLLIAKRFIAGETADDAIRAAERLQKDGILTNLNVLGEHVNKEEDANYYISQYLEMMQKARKNGLTTHISVKPTQIGMDISDDFCFQKLSEVINEAAKSDTFIRVDMEGTPYTERTMNLFLRAREQYKHIGIVLQAYLYRTDADIATAIGKQSAVRICKGAYKESSEHALQTMDAIVEQMKRQIETLLKSPIHHAVASHDDRIINFVKEYVHAHQIPKDHFDFQMLYGLRTESWHQLIKEGYKVRIYIPFGKHWFPYYSRRLRERKENVLFILKNLFKK